MCAMGLTIILYERFGMDQSFIFYLILFYNLLVVSIIDYQLHIIPNKLLVILFGTGIIQILLLQVLSLIDVLTGFLISLSIMLIIKMCGDLILMKESMGMGDIKLAAILGFYLGWQNFLETLFLGSLLALILHLGCINPGRFSYSSKIPLAPYLTFAAYLTVLFDGILKISQ
jgi:leader peptidase (prepilin peptidase)/N-methyltransferase